MFSYALSDIPNNLMQKFKNAVVAAELTLMTVVTQNHTSNWSFVYIETRIFRSWRPLRIDYLTAGCL